MQPDDKGNWKCCIQGCSNFTSRLISGQPVCTPHFLEGYGRFDNKPLPIPPEPERYISDKPKMGRPKSRR